MKNIIITFSILFSFCQIANAQIDKRDFKLLFNKGKIIRENEKEYLLITTATLVNNSKDTLRYLSRSCSWQDFYITNHKKIEIEKPDCDKNIPIILSLAPNESKSVELRLKVSSTNKSLNYRIGVNLVEQKETVEIRTHDYTKIESVTIWSDELKIRW